jgi:hypothetical protein
MSSHPASEGSKRIIKTLQFSIVKIIAKKFSITG